MQYEDVLKILLAGGSLSAGAFLTALRAKLANTKKKNWLHVSFYVVAGMILLCASLTLLINWRTIFKPDWFAIVVLSFAIVASVALIWVTLHFLAGKYQFTTKELDPIVNKFSRDADKRNIKLLAGNLDFFGQSPHQMNSHAQYICLNQENFNEIHILCTAPVTNMDRVRYGKIAHDFPTATFRYYKPTKADLNVRGRIKTLNNVTRLLIYNKITAGRYEALELDTADTNGVLYSHLWNLIWEIAEEPTAQLVSGYIESYNQLIQLQ